MSRSGYDEDYSESFPNALELYRHTVERALAGKRGQAFLRELVAALDALPEKRLVRAELVTPEGECCALGAVGLARGYERLDGLSDCEPTRLGRAFGIAASMAAEIMYENDEHSSQGETDERRWLRMRTWAQALIK